MMKAHASNDRTQRFCINIFASLTLNYKLASATHYT